MAEIDFILRQWHTPSAARHLMITTECDTQRPYLGPKSEGVVVAVPRSRLGTQLTTTPNTIPEANYLKRCV